MKNKLLLGVGIAAGYVLGSRSGRAAYDKLKARAAGIWDSKPLQYNVAVATETIKEKAPEVADQLTEAARRAGTVIGSAMHREGAAGDKKSSTSDDAATAGAASTGAAGTSGGLGTTGTGAASTGAAGTGAAGTSGSGDLGGDHIPAHSTHPETHNLGTSDETGSKS